MSSDNPLVGPDMDHVVLAEASLDDAIERIVEEVREFVDKDAFLELEGYEKLRKNIYAIFGLPALCPALRGERTPNPGRARCSRCGRIHE